MGLTWALVVCAACLVVGVFAGGAIEAARRRVQAPAVFKLLVWHFAPVRLETVVVTEREFPARVRVDLHRSIDRLFERCTIKHVCGIRLHDNMMFGVNLTELLAYSTNASAVPLGYEEVDVGEEKPIRCLRNGLWLLESAGVKVAVVLSQVFGFNEPPRVRFDVATENNRAGAAFAESFFSALEEAVRKAESYRGKVLSLETGGSYTGQSTGIKVHKLPAVARGDVILPEKTLALLERNVVQFVRQRKTLSALGQSAKKGLLFYGPPGNGKTHTIRYLIGELPGHTTLLISAEQVVQLGEYLALARLLAPTVVVLEDVDLIARERTAMDNPCQESLLNKLLNEMDGLQEDAEIVFLLTTNRPDELEEALAARPGRVDQVIEFPLPDRHGREKLVRLYSRAISVADELVELVVHRTEGVSASFIKELMRRSMQFRLATGGDGTIDAADVERALDELITGGGRLNQRVLGARYDPTLRGFG